MHWIIVAVTVGIVIAIASALGLTGMTIAASIKGAREFKRYVDETGDMLGHSAGEQFVAD